MTTPVDTSPTAVAGAKAAMALPPNPKQAYGDKKPNVALVPPALDLYAALALSDGAVKYGPYNWRDKSVEVMTYVAAIMRHLGAWVDRAEYSEVEPFTLPDGTRFILGAKPQLAHVAACVAILVDAIENGTAIDNRPAKGPALKIQGDWFGKLPAALKPDDAPPVREPEQEPVPIREPEQYDPRSDDVLNRLQNEAVERLRRREQDAIDRRGAALTAIIRADPTPPRQPPAPIGKYEHACPDLDEEYPLCDCPAPAYCSGLNAAPHDGSRGHPVACVKFKIKHERDFDVVT